MIPNSLLWVEPCCQEYGDRIPSLNAVENLQNVMGWGGNQTILQMAQRNKIHELILYDSNKKERTDIFRPAKVLTDWILDCEYLGIPLHWEGIRIKKFDKYSIYIHKETPRAKLWNFQPYPNGKMSTATLTLRVGGYLLDCWKLSNITITPVNETTNFLLRFNSYKQQVPVLGLSEIWVEYINGSEYLSGKLPRIENSSYPMIKFSYRITEEVRRTLDYRLDKYNRRYQHFMLDLLRQKSKWEI